MLYCRQLIFLHPPTDSESIDAIVTGEASRTYRGNDVTSREMRMHHVMNGRWPYESGCAQLVLGLILSFLGLCF